MAESFFKTLKVEMGGHFASRNEAYQQLFGYIDGFYNTRRLHSSLGYLSPVSFERHHAKTTPAGQLDVAFRGTTWGLESWRTPANVNPLAEGELRKR